MNASQIVTSNWLEQNKLFLFWFLVFVSMLCIGTFFVSEPILLYAAIGFLMLSATSLLFVENSLDCLLLLFFAFSIDLLFVNIGSLAVLVGLSIVLIASIIRSLAQGFDEWRDAIYVKEMLIFIFVAFLSLFWGNPAFGGVTRFVINLLVGFLLFYITHFAVSSFRSLSYLTIILLVILAANAVYGLYLHLTFGFRVTSFFLDTPTYSGHYFVQGIVLAVGAYLSYSFRQIRPFLIIVMIILFIAAVLTFTRGAWLALCFFFFANMFFSKIPKKYLLLGGIGVAVVLFIFLFFLGTGSESATFKARVTVDLSTASIGVGSIAFRILLWQSAWGLFLTSPLLGIGFDNFVTLDRLTPNYPIIQGLGGADLYVHNIYLQILAETGMVGFAVFLIFLISIFKSIFRMFRQMKGHPYQQLFWGYGWVMTLWLFMGLTEGSLYTPTTAGFFFFNLGVLSGVHKLLARSSRPAFVQQSPVSS